MKIVTSPIQGYRNFIAATMTVLFFVFGIAGCDNNASKSRDNSETRADDGGTVDINSAGVSSAEDSTSSATTVADPAVTTSASTAATSDVTVSAATIAIRLPRDRSKFLPGPDMPLTDGTACLSCHSQGDVNEFLTMRSPNFEVTKEICGDCHSADYVSSQPPGLGKPGWQKVVSKMVTRFDPNSINSTLNPHHQALMVDYLSATYDP